MIYIYVYALLYQYLYTYAHPFFASKSALGVVNEHGSGQRVRLPRVRIFRHKKNVSFG